MSYPFSIHRSDAATDAERLADQLLDEGGFVYLLIPPTGFPKLAFQFGMLPPAPRACEIAALIRSRFFTDEQFRKDLFGWLYVEGDVYQRYAERQPRVLLGCQEIAQ